MMQPLAGSGDPSAVAPTAGAASGPVAATGADIAVVVVTYQSASTIEDCLARLRGADGVGAIRVVDNRSTDGGLEIIQRHAAADPRVRFIANPDNPGFAVACNQGAADAAGSAPQCRWLAFVNPDALVEVDTLSRLRALAAGPTRPDARLVASDTGAAKAGEGNERPMLLGVDLVDEGGKRDPAARRRNPDFIAMLVNRLPRVLQPGANKGAADVDACARLDPTSRSGTSAGHIDAGTGHRGNAAAPASAETNHDAALPAHAVAASAAGGTTHANLAEATAGEAFAPGSLAVAPDDSRELQPVAAISGALMFLPRRLFERIGGFDEAYRLHAEDLDLCRRAAAAGAVVAVANRVRVVHVRGVSSRSNPWFVEWHKHRGLWRYFGKFEAARRGPLLRLAVFAAIWSRFPFAIGRALLRRR